VSERPVVVVDPYRRRMDEIFSSDDLSRLHDTCEVVWGEDEPMPLEDMSEALARARRGLLRLALRRCF
jgi:hypothetical protein